MNTHMVPAIGLGLLVTLLGGILSALLAVACADNMLCWFSNRFARLTKVFGILILTFHVVLAVLPGYYAGRWAYYDSMCTAIMANEEAVRSEATKKLIDATESARATTITRLQFANLSDADRIVAELNVRNAKTIAEINIVIDKYINKKINK